MSGDAIVTKGLTKDHGSGRGIFDPARFAEMEGFPALPPKLIEVGT